LPVCRPRKSQLSPAWRNTGLSAATHARQSWAICGLPRHSGKTCDPARKLSDVARSSAARLSQCPAKAISSAFMVFFRFEQSSFPVKTCVVWKTMLN